jgi:exodeoxyribonuclease III
MKITTWNVNGIRAREAQVLDWVQKEQPDVLCLQEIKASPQDVPAGLCALEGYWCYWHGHKGYSGVALHVRKASFPESVRFVHPAFDHENRIVTVQLGNVVVASIYVPNGGKDYPAKVRFLEALDEFVEASHRSGLKLALCGDLNVARLLMDVHPKLQKADQIGQTPEERGLFEKILGRGLIDLGRQFEPENDRLFTWWAPWRNLRERNIGWRLDYVLCSRALAEEALSCVAAREFGTSDHGPVTATFRDTEHWRTPAAAQVAGNPGQDPKGQLGLGL